MGYNLRQYRASYCFFVLIADLCTPAADWHTTFGTSFVDVCCNLCALIAIMRIFRRCCCGSHRSVPAAWRNIRDVIFPAINLFHRIVVVVEVKLYLFLSSPSARDDNNRRRFGFRAFLFFVLVVFEKPCVMCLNLPNTDRPKAGSGDGCLLCVDVITTCRPAVSSSMVSLSLYHP